MPSVLGTAIAIQSREGVGTAVALALPLSIFLQMWEKRLLRHRRQLGGKQIEKPPGPEKFKKGKHVGISSHTASWDGGVHPCPGVLCHVFWRRSINAVIADPRVLDGFDVAAGVLSLVWDLLLIKMMGNKKTDALPVPGIHSCHGVSQYGCDWEYAVAGLCMALIAVGNMKFEEEEDF